MNNLKFSLFCCMYSGENIVELYVSADSTQIEKIELPFDLRIIYCLNYTNSYKELLTVSCCDVIKTSHLTLKNGKARIIYKLIIKVNNKVEYDQIKTILENDTVILEVVI